LPHISVAGATSTGTHGSGAGTRILGAAGRRLGLIGPDGELRTVSRGEPAFDGSVVALGAIGAVVSLDLDVEPEGLVEQIGDKLGFVSKRAEGDLERFKEFIESRPQETGAWRGQL
ncbi:MAG: hypothetical protein KY439_06065, partial [Actinobacteria bacterium]|nr:hypothetical protein [Actinomycetota bacterium]